MQGGLTLNIKELDIKYLPQMPANKSRGIGIVGAGAIITGAQLPAYKIAGFNVVGITNRTRSRAESAAKSFDIPNVYDNIEDMLSNDDIEILDIALTPDTQMDAVRIAAPTGRHFLCQKPLHEKPALAAQIVKMANEAGVKLAVNQQLRWDGRMRAVKYLFENGYLGEPTLATINVNIHNPFDLPWLGGDHVEVMYHSIHYFDTIRYLFGEPDRIFSSGGKLSTQDRPGETRSTTILEYASGATVLVHSSSNNTMDTEYAEFRFEGTEGIVRGDFHLFSGAAKGNPRVLTYVSNSLDNRYTFDFHIPELRVPHAFIGPMASLMKAIEEDSTPDPSGEDNLHTVRLVNAIYRSMREHRAIEKSEF